MTGRHEFNEQMMQMESGTEFVYFAKRSDNYGDAYA